MDRKEGCTVLVELYRKQKQNYLVLTEGLCNLSPSVAGRNRTGRRLKTPP